MPGGEVLRFDLPPTAAVANLTGADYFLVASDFTDYWRAQREVDRAYADQKGWARMAALNVARSGWFSSDRTIAEYAREIWGIPVA